MKSKIWKSTIPLAARSETFVLPGASINRVMPAPANIPVARARKSDENMATAFSSVILFK